MLGKTRDLRSLTKPSVFSEYFSCLCWAKIHELEGEHTITQTNHLSFTTLARPLGKKFENKDTLWVSYSLYSSSPGSKFSDLPSKALKEEAVGGFNLLPSTGPVATWMGRRLSSRLAWSTWVWKFDSSQVRSVFRPRVLSLFLLGESKADV